MHTTCTNDLTNGYCLLKSKLILLETSPLKNHPRSMNKLIKKVASSNKNLIVFFFLFVVPMCLWIALSLDIINRTPAYLGLLGAYTLAFLLIYKN